MDWPCPPAVKARPKLAAWLFDRGLSNRDVAEIFGQSHETVRRFCLPFGDPLRRIPNEETLERIFEYTGGEITPADFYPEHLRRGFVTPDEVFAAAQPVPDYPGLPDAREEAEAAE